METKKKKSTLKTETIEDDELDEFYQVADISSLSNQTKKLPHNWPNYSLPDLAAKLSDIRLEWKVYDQELLYSVTEISIDNHPQTISSLHRENYDSYHASCQQQIKYPLPLFPVDNNILAHFPFLIAQHEHLGPAIKTSSPTSSFREEFFHLSRVIKSIRIRKIVLTDSVIQFKSKSLKCSNFLELCEMKLSAHLNRLNLLENELTLLEPLSLPSPSPENKDFHPKSLLTSFLSTEVGWSTTITYLAKEYRYQAIQQQEEQQAASQPTQQQPPPPTQDQEALAQDQETTQQQQQQQSQRQEEENDNLRTGKELEKILQRQGLGLSLSTIRTVLLLMKYWQLLYSISVRAFLEKDSLYRTHCRFTTLTTTAAATGTGTGTSGADQSVLKSLSVLSSSTAAAAAGAGGAGGGGKGGKNKKKPLTKNQLKKTLSLAPSRDDEDIKQLGRVSFDDDDLSDEETAAAGATGEDKGSSQKAPAVLKGSEIQKQYSKKQLSKQDSAVSATGGGGRRGGGGKGGGANQEPLVNPLLPCGNICLVPWNEICVFLEIPVPPSYLTPQQQLQQQEDQEEQEQEQQEKQREKERKEFLEYESVVKAIGAVIQIFSSSQSSNSNIGSKEGEQGNEQEQEQEQEEGRERGDGSRHAALLSYLKNQTDLTDDNNNNSSSGSSSSQSISRATLSELIFLHRDHQLQLQSSAPSAPSAAASVSTSAPSAVESTRLLGLTLLELTDDVAKLLEEILHKPLRRLSIWSSILENLRRARVKREGGQLILRDNGEVEVDEQGAIRVIPNADEIVDTDILHGSRQRVRIQVNLPSPAPAPPPPSPPLPHSSPAPFSSFLFPVLVSPHSQVAIPQAKYKIQLLAKRQYETEGELACLTQLGYSLATPYLQRVARGTRVRKQIHRYLRRNLVYYAMHAAAVLIQCCHRALQGRKRFKTFIQQRKHNAAVQIQKIIRGFGFSFSALCISLTLLCLSFASLCCCVECWEEELGMN
jgi:hypothetical protein